MATVLEKGSDAWAQGLVEDSRFLRQGPAMGPCLKKKREGRDEKDSNDTDGVNSRVVPQLLCVSGI